MLDGGRQLGIIPAYAGSTSKLTSTRQSRRDHPRIRGEHEANSLDGQTMAGSSPHTRGAHAALDVEGLAARIIPAYAGSTGLRRRRCRAPRDHPRIRGEHARRSTGNMDSTGSSPHTRGAQVVAEPRPQEQGIIPAYAGSTRFWCRRRPREWDHPRIRGEHADRDTLHRGDAGSSPHTRGAPRPLTPLLLGSRIIPAYAGSTREDQQKIRTRRDHPRIRGEHVRHRLLHYERRRIIPAYAGSTCRRPLASPTGRDHPRIRGEHDTHGAAHECRPGSSPHTRGALP